MAPVSPEELASVASARGVPLPPERLQEIAEHVNGLFTFVRELHGAVELDDPPAMLCLEPEVD